MRSVALILIIAVSVQAKPDRPVPKEKEVKPIFPAKCQYGDIKTDGKVVSIVGEVWLAEGLVRANGSIFLLWTEIRTGRVAPSIYHVTDKGICGLWGWSDEVTEQDGVLTGRLNHDTIRDVSMDAATPGQ